MKYFSLLICAVSLLTGCNNITYTTNIDDEVLSEHVSSHTKKRGLEQFYSVQDALDRGASPLGGIKGESCDVSDDELAQLSVRITEIGFPQDVVGSLMESLHACHGKSKGAKTNVRLQNWEA